MHKIENFLYSYAFFGMKISVCVKPLNNLVVLLLSFGLLTSCSVKLIPSAPIVEVQTKIATDYYVGKPVSVVIEDVKSAPDSKMNVNGKTYYTWKSVGEMVSYRRGRTYTSYGKDGSYSSHDSVTSSSTETCNLMIESGKDSTVESFMLSGEEGHCYKKFSQVPIDDIRSKLLETCVSREIIYELNTNEKVRNSFHIKEECKDIEITEELFDVCFQMSGNTDQAKFLQSVERKCKHEIGS
jgi:hypothetical protein